MPAAELLAGVGATGMLPELASAQAAIATGSLRERLRDAGLDRAARTFGQIVREDLQDFTIPAKPYGFFDAPAGLAMMRRQFGGHVVKTEEAVAGARR